jgi:hypothetical protein
MAATSDRAASNVGKRTPPESNPTKESDPTQIDRNAPAGSEDSLGAEGVRDGRPSTDDSVVEAMDEESPGLISE